MNILSAGCSDAMRRVYYYSFVSLLAMFVTKRQNVFERISMIILLGMDRGEECTKVRCHP